MTVNINNMTLQLRKAERKKAKLRIGLGGPSGSGKTYSALLLANGLTDWEKIVVIDTENGSGELYSHLGPYNVITIQNDFAPERYIEAIKACEQGGMEVIIIDSISHEWEGKGGCLELVEQITQASTSKNSYTSWGKVTPRHQKFIDSILQSPCHVITTVRKKQDYDMSKDSNNKTVITKVGMKEITRDGFEYELTLSLNLTQNNFASVSKDRTELFMNKPEFKIDQKTGKELLAWSESGAEVNTPPKKPDMLKTEIMKLCNELEIVLPKTDDKEVLKETFEKFIDKKTGFKLEPEFYNMIITRLKSIKSANEFEKDLAEPVKN